MKNDPNEYIRNKFHMAICDMACSNEKLSERVYSAFIYYLIHINEANIPELYRDDWQYVTNLLSMKTSKHTKDFIEKNNFNSKTINDFEMREQNTFPPPFLRDIHYTKLKKAARTIIKIYEELYSELEEKVWES